MENTMINETMETVVEEVVMTTGTEEVMVEQVAKGGFGKKAVVAGLVLGAGVLLYKQGKKLVKKHKAKKGGDVELVEVPVEAAEVTAEPVVEEKVVNMDDKKKSK